MNKSVLAVGLCALVVPAFAVSSADSATQTATPIVPDKGSAVVPVAVTYKDGNYTGPAVDAYWGKVQVQAVVENGQIASLTILKYPSDRRESQRINQQALPLLRNEVVKAQAARVNIISGATLTSQAFMRSLDAALIQAGGTPSVPGLPSQPGVPNGRIPGGLGI